MGGEREIVDVCLGYAAGPTNADGRGTNTNDEGRWLMYPLVGAARRWQRTTAKPPIALMDLTMVNNVGILFLWRCGKNENRSAQFGQMLDPEDVDPDETPFTIIYGGNTLAGTLPTKLHQTPDITKHKLFIAANTIRYLTLFH